MSVSILITSALGEPKVIRNEVKCDLWRMTRDTTQTAFRHALGDLTSLEKDLVMDILPRSRSPTISINHKHPFILEPFGDPLPVPDRYKSRFKPARYNKNVFYSGRSEAVPIHESAYYILRERIHLDLPFDKPRTLFSVPFVDHDCLDISGHLSKLVDIDIFYQ